MMKVISLILFSCLAALLTSCTKMFYVEANIAPSGTVLSFYDKGGEGKKEINPCIWSIDIIDDNTEKPILRLVMQDKCVNFPRINISEPLEGFMTTGSARNLKLGNTYHAEVSADEGVGRSDPWKQR